MRSRTEGDAESDRNDRRDGGSDVKGARPVNEPGPDGDKPTDDPESLRNLLPNPLVFLAVALFVVLGFLALLLASGK
jgi:hypothetical protein